MTFKEAYGAAFKAALGIIGFYIVSGGVILLGLGVFLVYGEEVAGIALAVLGIALAWLSAFAVIIKVSVDEATRHSAPRIDEKARSAVNRLAGRSESPAPLAEADVGKMSWREAFGMAIKATLWIFLANIVMNIVVGVGVGLIVGGGALWVTQGDAMGILGALLIVAGAALALFAFAVAILYPPAVIIGYSITTAEKRLEPRIAAAARFITDRLDEREASAPDGARGQ